MTGVIGTGQTSRPGGVTRPGGGGYIPLIRAWLHAHPGCTQRSLCEGLGVKADDLRPVLAHMLAMGWLCDHGDLRARARLDRGHRFWLRSECLYLHPAKRAEAGESGAESKSGATSAPGAYGRLSGPSDAPRGLSGPSGRYGTPATFRRPQRKRYTGPRGSAHPHAKLDEATVLACRRRWAQEGADIDTAEWARQLGVVESTLLRALSGESWRHLPLFTEVEQ